MGVEIVWWYRWDLQNHSGYDIIVTPSLIG